MITNIPVELKLNRFKSVAVPKPRDYFARYGFTKCPSNLYSGDESVCERSKSKIETLVEGEKVVEDAILKHQNDGK